jgi:hypothetical protein
MNSKAVAAVLAIVLLVVGIVCSVMWFLAFNVPADVAYSRKFGSDVTMATQGSTTLTGAESIQDYVNRIWTSMNATFDARNFDTIYNSPWPWGQIPENSMAKENSYFISLNASISQRQQMVNTIIEKGGYIGTDPVQAAINQSRSEMNAYGGLDWVIKPAWYLQFAPMAYWSAMIGIILWVIDIVIAIILFAYAGSY